MRLTLKKSEILRGSKNFEHLLKNCKKFEGSILRCYVTSKPREVGRSDAGVVAAFAVKKSLKRAVDRNRIRRRMREAYRMNKALLLPRIQESGNQIQILFMYSTPKKSGSILPLFEAVRDDMVNLLETISKAKLERS